ncbi:hypothetical protein TH53_22365 [Pedobacter lusitanus]|uniref:Uncharacterized protein n=1 Tax=Pedobacter lusitanus TaxID=1503925 RepID=A0A0D0FRR2_9SPHI|nr:SEL1-like repeat protein [Pedobacter lusitanus]KIO75164.1 hypothetical protein TH53_22365 [Pedobacter lusitanus]
MSHRVYLYNTGEPDELNGEEVMMMEWGYELSILLHPLLTGKSILADSNFDLHISLNPDEPLVSPSLFYEAPGGKENFKRFYNFIEKYQEELIDRPEQFKTAKENLFKYLDDLNQPYFQLNASDVFNMSEQSHADQARELLEDINYNNTVINNAIDADDHTQLNLALFTKHTGLGFKDFKALLNYPDFDYGWAIIDHPEPADVVIFEENELWGLKDSAGKILIAPVYQEFYNFSYDDMAVVAVAGQFGYVSKNGDEVIKPQFDDAFDFEEGYAPVIKNGLYGLIDKKGTIIIDFRYQELTDILSNGQYFTAQLNDKWGVIDIKDRILLPFELDNCVESANYGSAFMVSLPHKKAKSIYTSRFVYLTECEPHLVKELNIPGESYLYQVIKNKQTDENILYNDQGQLLLSGYEKIVNNLYYIFVVRKQKKQGIINYKGEVILGFDYDRIDQLETYLNEPSQSLYPAIPDEAKDELCCFFSIKQQKKCGIYLSAGNFHQQLTGLLYDEITSLSNTMLAVRENGQWGVVDVFGKPLSAITYDFIIRCNKSADSAYAYRDNHVVIISPETITDADLQDLQYDIDSNKEYGYYNFDSDKAMKLQSYIDKDLPAGDILTNKAMDLLESENSVKAIELLQQATELGHARAMNELAIIYEDADNQYPEYKNEQESFKLFLKSAQAGSYVAMYNTGICYSSGMGTPADPEQMCYWYTAALNAGYMPAAIKLGNYYYDRAGGNENYEQALKYYIIAEKEGETLNVELAWLYHYFGDHTHALPYLLKAAADDESYAHWQLGTYAQDGIEMKVNIRLAIDRYKKAADKEYSDAYVNLHQVYSFIPGFENKALAAVYKEKAESAGLQVVQKQESLLDKFINIFRKK